MSRHLSKRPKLAIISDTNMWHTPSGTAVHEPTLREVEAFAELFQSVRWTGYLLDSPQIKNAATTTHERVTMLPLTGSGGDGILDKFKVLAKTPAYLWHIIKEIRNADIVHTRGPSVPALFAVWLSYLFKRKLFWNKYAGNWESPIPKSYRLLKRTLQKAKHTRVTINGKWPNQESHVISTVNPCLTETEIAQGLQVAQEKTYTERLTICFVGRLEPQKGLDRIIEALLSMKDLDAIEQVLLVGEGNRRSHYEKLVAPLGGLVKFTGSLSRSELNTIYSKSHFILLPSESEGFPKVVPEAGAYGCIPICSAVSSLGQFIQHQKNGYLLQQNTSQELADLLTNILTNRLPLQQIANTVVEQSSLFTYDTYLDLLRTKVLNASRYDF